MTPLCRVANCSWVCLSVHMASTRTTITVHGPALRELRVRAGMPIQDLAEACGVKRPHLTKVELGRNRKVSPRLFNALLDALGIKDRRVLMADPYAEDVAA